MRKRTPTSHMSVYFMCDDCNDLHGVSMLDSMFTAIVEDLTRHRTPFVLLSVGLRVKKAQAEKDRETVQTLLKKLIEAHENSECVRVTSEGE